MSPKRPQTAVLVFSIIAVLAVVAVLFLMHKLTSKETQTTHKPSQTTQEKTDTPPDIHLEELDKLVTDTGFTGSAEELVGHISEIMIQANSTGDLQPFIDLIGKPRFSDIQLKQLQQLAIRSQLKLNRTTPFSRIQEKNENETIWSLNLADQQSILLKLTQNKNGTWQVDTITLPQKSTSQRTAPSLALKKNSTTPTPNSDTNQAAATVQQFLDTILKLDPSGAEKYIDPEKISYATLAGLCIVFEEGRYQLSGKNALRKMFLTNNTAGWITRVKSPDTQKTAMFALTTKRTNPQAPWKITEINLDKLLSDYANRFSGGDIHYVPIIKNPHGGDSIVLFFELDSNQLSHRTCRQLDIIAQVLKSYPERKLTISGHTDATGTDSHNLTLSKQRAEQVRTFLTTQGVSGQQMKVVGFGKSKPRQPNTTNDGRRVNRRAEILLDF
jgi:outer membrane protein OmpA-like peptidoglycan-associated protein